MGSKKKAWLFTSPAWLCSTPQNFCTHTIVRSPMEECMLCYKYHTYSGEETKGRKDRKKMGPKSRVYSSALYNNTHLPCFRGSTSTSLGAQKPLSDTLYYIELPKHFSRHTRFFSCRLFFREACSVFFVTPISIITIAIYCLQISYGPCAFKSDNCSYSVWRLF